MIAERLFAVLLLALSLPSFIAHAAEENSKPDAEATVRALVVDTYDFVPHELSDAEQARKSDELDRFWSQIGEMGPDGLDGLRSALETPGYEPFFYFDGAMLLKSKSKTPDDRQRILNAMKYTDLRSIDQTSYFRVVHELAVDGYDTTEAAFKILEQGQFTVVVPAHALTLEMPVALLYMVLPMQEEMWMARAQSEFSRATSESSQEALALLIGQAATPEGDVVLRRFAEDPRTSMSMKAYVGSLLNLDESPDLGALNLPAGSYKRLKEKQREVFRTVSDESLHDWILLQIAIRRAAKKGN